MAERLLAKGQRRLVDMGFGEMMIEAVSKKIEIGIARDIVNWSERKRADAVVISTRGRGKLAAFFLGETANKVLEHSRTCPVWIVKGTVKKKHVILAIDNSKNALRAVGHAAFMLSGTDVDVTVFHSKRDLKRFLPKEVADEFPELQKFWQRKAGKVILPFIQKAKEMLLEAGLREGQIATKLIDGSRGAAADILEEMKSSEAGSLFIGLHGYSSVKDFTMGSITRKVLNQAEDMAVCIVP
jgi:nucleotide-binding universal stress UspA family protein